MFDDVSGPDQTTLIRVLIVVGIGLPIVIEVATFGGMLSHYVAGGGGDAGTAAAKTPTPEVAGADIDDEILAEADPTVHIERASVLAADESWQFVLTLNVTNAGEQSSAVQVGAVTAHNGATVAGAGTTGELGPSESGRVTGSWSLPLGERPDTVEITVVTETADGASDETAYTVALGDIPVSNQ
ncbi:hypothetical protein ACFQJ5_09900 [Halomicroarcula sp. GCM10025324]|uniref:hypothetical protein n=1 Tax=Haloarcula TaxID=2237 RepID=UPI0023E86B14|nr:hypothetical protein [Halomicroarcula sp. ZS-22-S1]